MLKSLLFSILFFSFTIYSFAQDNLIKNGQFADGTNNWEVLLLNKDEPIKAHIEHSDGYKEYGLADNFVGTNFVELDQKSAIQQVIPTRKNGIYTLAFAFAPRPNAGTKQLIVTAGKKVIYTTTLNNSDDKGVFIYKTVNFTATENYTKIGFHAVSILSNEDDKGILLTDILCNLSSTVDVNRISSDKKF
ncbi:MULTISPECIES: DUF642 domain-containing protein [unclassified Aureispira]|uniref:DUF642 domain-containing protein n=1 Tax=unclassified Aureispira TaxID=2649989 RepID=UPI000696E04D|nr:MULTISPECIES: DUF642 domain-containing protein [unclassified Aureispira]WMX13413.1 DUF642 domain-containing protein [Aureispira sp. CCB-E]